MWDSREAALRSRHSDFRKAGWRQGDIPSGTPRPPIPSHLPPPAPPSFCSRVLMQSCRSSVEVLGRDFPTAPMQPGCGLLRISIALGPSEAISPKSEQKDWIVFCPGFPNCPQDAHNPPPTSWLNHSALTARGRGPCSARAGPLPSSAAQCTGLHEMLVPTSGKEREEEARQRCASWVNTNPQSYRHPASGAPLPRHVSMPGSPRGADNWHCGKHVLVTEHPGKEPRPWCAPLSL